MVNIKAKSTKNSKTVLKICRFVDFDFGSGAPKRAKKSLSFVSSKVTPAEDEEVTTLLDSSITGVDDHSSRQVPEVPEIDRMELIQEEINRTSSASRKRKAVDLFGDIEDIELEEFFCPSNLYCEIEHVKY